MNFQTNYVKNYDCLRIAAFWAGGLGVVQSIIWISLTTTGIFAYNCLVDLPAAINFGTIVRYVFFYLYFKGDCKADVYQSFNNTILETVDRILDPTQILIWISVYLAVSICWLLASVSLLAYIKKDDVTMTVRILYSWVTITFLISALDLAQAIIFGIDGGNFHEKAHLYGMESDKVNPNGVLLIAGEISAFSLMIISLKGFVLWIINVGCLIYLLLLANSIVSDKGENETLFMPRNDSVDILTTRRPISAFENGKFNASYYNDGFMADNSSMGTIKLNQDAIIRAARMSIDNRLQEHRFRNLDSFQQYPPPHNNNNTRRESVKAQETVTTTAAVTTSQFPAPDYSDY